MRILMIAAAAGLGLGAPVLAPASMMPAVLAQAGPTQAQIDALEAEILAAPDQAAVDAIIARETAVGNFDLLAESLSEAAVTLAQTDLAGAANLVTLAVTASESGSSEVQMQVGNAASTVATTARENGETAISSSVASAVQNSSAISISDGFAGAGGDTGVAVTYTGPTDTGSTEQTPAPEAFEPTPDDTTTGDDTTTTGGDTTTTAGDDTTTTGADTTTPTDTVNQPTGALTIVLPVAPPAPPNPAQIINPIELVEPPRAQDTDSIV